MKLAVFALGFIIVFGSIGWVVTKYEDALPAPPSSHEIELNGTPSNDIDHMSAVLMRADFRQMATKENIPLGHMTFYSSEADPGDVRTFYLHALSIPWQVEGDRESGRRRTIIYHKLFESEMKIIIIEKRLTRDAANHVTDGPGSIVGIDEVAAQ